MRKDAGDFLAEFAKVFKEKNDPSTGWGNSYYDFGRICASLFPNGLSINSESEFCAAGVLFMMLHKIVRSSKAFTVNGINSNFGTLDSLKDLSVYSAMLFELLSEGLGDEKSYP